MRDPAHWALAGEFGQVSAWQASELVEAFAIDLQFLDAVADGGDHAVVIGELGQGSPGGHIQPLAWSEALSSPVAMLLVVECGLGVPKLSPSSTSGGFSIL